MDFGRGAARSRPIQPDCGLPELNLADTGVNVTTFDVTIDGVVFSGGSATTLAAFTSAADLLPT